MSKRFPTGDIYGDVRAFHEACNLPSRTRFIGPVPLPADRAKLRGDLLKEEAKEFRQAAKAGDQAGMLDAAVDIIYVAVGAAVEAGWPLDEAWKRVHAANMAKRQPDGTVHYREDGKVLKPEGWRSPVMFDLVVEP